MQKMSLPTLMLLGTICGFVPLQAYEGANSSGQLHSQDYQAGYNAGLQEGATEAGQADASMLQGQENQANTPPPEQGNPNYEQPSTGENWNFGYPGG